MRLFRRTLGKHKETRSRSSGHDARAYLRRLLPRPSGPHNRSPSKPNVHASPSALRSRLLAKNYRRARFNCSGIYRGFWTNGNGFLRGIRIRILSRDVCICARFREKQHRKIILEGFGSVFTPRQAGNLAATLCSLACWQAEKDAGSASLAQASRRGVGNRSQANVSSLCQLGPPGVESLWTKEKGDPRAALPVPDTGMVVSDGFRRSHHVHTASSARLTR